MALMGQVKNGKTHFALTAPTPMAYFNLDNGLEGVVHKFAGREIYVKNIDMPSPDDVNAEKTAEQAWEDFLTSYEKVLAMPEIRTVVIDTATELWELVRLAKFGKLTEVPPQYYSLVNRKFKKLIRAADMAKTKNLILIQKLKEVWVNKKWTGEYTLDGYNGTAGMVQVVANLQRFDKEVLFNGNPVNKGDFALTVVDCRHNPMLNNTYLTGPLCTFPFLASSVIDGTVPGMFE